MKDLKFNISKLKFVSASTVSLEAFAVAFASAFEGYAVSFNVDAGWLARRVRHEQQDIFNSLVVLEGSEAVGMAVLAARGTRGWCGGFGVAPRWRGRGLGQRLMSELVGRARASGLRSLSLEVLVGNTAAIRLYERAGMRVTRDLLVLKRPDEWTPPAAPRGSTLKEAPSAELLGHFARLHSDPPVWQREPPTLLTTEQQGLYLGPRSRPRAYVLLRRPPEGGTFVTDLAAADARQARALCAALGHIEGALTVNNEPEQSLFVAPLGEYGFREILRQHEMTMEL